MIRELTHVRLLFGVFDSDADQVSILVHLNQDIIVQIPGLDYLAVIEIDNKRVPVKEIPNVHLLPTDQRDRAYT